MAMNTFFIQDTSPIFTYSAGWTPAYHPKGNGFDETFHQAVSDAEIISFNISGKSASSLHFSTPYSDASPAKCDVQYRVDGSAWTGGCDVKDVTKGWHTVDLKSQGSGSMQFLGVRGEMRLGSESQHRNITIDNISSAFTYSASPSAWTLINSAGPLGAVQNQTAANTFGDKGGFFAQSLGMSTAGGAKAELKFKGEAVYLYGMSGPEMGLGEMVLDGKMISRVNMTLPWRSYSSLLFMAGDLDGSMEHTLSFTNTIAGQTALVDYAIITQLGDDKPTLNLPLILGAAGGGVGIALIICIFLYCCISRRRKARRRQASSFTIPPSKSGSGSTSYSDTPKSIDDWRKLSNGAGSPISPVSICFTDASLDTRSTAQLVQLNRSPAPDNLGSGLDYADYIPYNGPIEPRPTALSAPQGDPLGIAGGSPAAASWLLAQSGSTTNNSISHSGRRSLTPSTSVSARSLASPYSSASLNHSSPSISRSLSAGLRPAPPVRTGSRESTSTLDVPLTATDYYSRRDQARNAAGSPNDVRMTTTDLFSSSSATPTPTPTRRMRDSTIPPSSAGSDMASVQNATITFVTNKVGSQSVARVWSRSPDDELLHHPTEDTLGVSATRGGTPDPIPGQAMQPRDSAGRFPPHLPQIASTGGFSNLYAAYGGTTSAVPSTAQSQNTPISDRPIPSAIPSSAALPSSYPSPSTSLRRGPSIISVRTARSFFSGLLASGDAPAVPRWDGGSRPDRDLFGDSVSVKRRPSEHEGSMLRSQQRAAMAAAGTGSEHGRHPPQPLRLINDDDEGGGTRNMFIELDPNSPMTIVSRPGSEQPHW